VTLVRGRFDEGTQLGETEVIWFAKDSGEESIWRQHRSLVQERCYEKNAILAALSRAGFTRIEVVSAKDAGMNAELGFGRYFFSARR
jgi:hypothetical protein